MITTGFDSRVKVQQIIENQLPEFLLSESPKVTEFLKQYYISQEYQGGPIDIVENLDQYLNLNNLTPEVINDLTVLEENITLSDTEIFVNSTKGFPKSYGLFKIDDEIITYTGITTNSFTGCIRGFSGIVAYKHQTNPEELVFSESSSSNHVSGTKIENLSAKFLREFYKKIKYLFAPGFEDIDFVPELNVNNFIKQIRNFYSGKGTDDSFRILFNVLYNVDPKIVNLEDFLLKPSNAIFIRREILVTQKISGDPNKLVGQTVRNSSNTASGPVSEVEILSRGFKTFYKIQLFAGYSEKSLIEGTFLITPTSKVSDFVESGSSTITVDSTIGFPDSGILVTENNIRISYTDKSINQFFGCSGISEDIQETSSIRSDEILYGYEDGDETKLVELIVTGVLSDIRNKDRFNLLLENEPIKVRTLGEKIFNNNESYKEFFFNTWIYNVRSRYDILSFENNRVTLYETPDKSSLKRLDTVDILDINSENIIVSEAVITNISSNIITLNKNIIGVNSNRKLCIRRKYSYAKSDEVSNIDLRSSKILSNIQNTYNDRNEYAYVASNSLPDYPITKKIFFAELNLTQNSNLNDIFQGYNPLTDLYSILTFEDNVPFITGDAVVYTGTGTEINGLSFGIVYYVEIIKEGSRTNHIRLYASRSFINTDKYIEFERTNQVSTHTFTLLQHYNKQIVPKKSLHRIPLSQNIKSGTNQETPSGPIGVMINGVEIINYKSDDRIYYGPLDEIKVYNGGDDYDVINPPVIAVSNPGMGITALVQPVVNGSVKEVLVDPQQFSISKILSSSIVGGNGFGAKIKPVLSESYRELDFNGIPLTFGNPEGGVDISNETITFKTEHNLVDGERIVYNSNGNSPLGIGDFGGSNTDQEKYLVNGSIYYPKVINPRTIYLFNTEIDAISGINTIGFTTTNNSGVHKFRLYEKSNTISEIKVLDPGYDYENRKLRVLPTGISTSYNVVTYPNHGLRDGAVVHYSYEDSQIIGLSTENQYQVIKLNDSQFQLSDAGPIYSTLSSDNFVKKNFVKFETPGSGYQIFEYPPIRVIIDAEIIGAGNTIVTTPVVRGSIVDTYLYEPGTNYGSKILNFHKKPFLFVRTGQESQLKPIINGGRIVNVEVQNGGKYYNAPPDLIISGDGEGAKLRSVVEDGKIKEIVVINSGTNYSKNKTTVRAKSPGRNCVLDSFVRYLRVNNFSRFSEEILYEYGNDLSYGVVGYSVDREGNSFLDPEEPGLHSKVIGWAYDGNPIYGPYGFSDPKDENSDVRILKTGYEASFDNVHNRPLDDSFPLGFFVEDYKFSSNSDLDIHNGRFSKTPEFPNGIYAYHIGVSTDLQTSKLVSQFPYFIGDTYRSLYKNPTIDQGFDFNNSDLVRNTFPYRVNQEYSRNDFIEESSRESTQLTIVESVTRGGVDELVIINPGENYKVGNTVIFDNTDTDGGGASAEVSQLQGKNILSLETSYEKYEESTVIRESDNLLRIYTNNYHPFANQNTIRISGVSTSINNLEKTHLIGVSSDTSSLIEDLQSNVGIVTDIYVSSISSLAHPESYIRIGEETLKILNIFENENILRVERGDLLDSHPSSEKITYFQDSFTIPLETNYFNSSNNFKTFFNPKESVGIGSTLGIENLIDFYVGKSKKTTSIPTQSIYIPNHNFKTNQRVLLTKPSSASPLSVYIEPGDNLFNLPVSGNSQYVYIINKSKDFIGIVTEVGLTTSSKGIYFSGYGSNDYRYELQPTGEQVTATAERIETKITTTEEHGLQFNDVVFLNLNSNLSVGIGTSSSIYLKHSKDIDKLILNPVGFSSGVVDSSGDKIYIENHGYNTGDRIFYKYFDAGIVGLTTGLYYILRIDDHNFRLSSTYFDSTSNPPNFVSMGSSGGTNQEIGLVNPQISVIRDNNLVFDVSDSSLVGYELKFYYDNEYNNEFVTTGVDNNFSVEKVGNSGEPESKVTILYDDSIPNKLYYSLEKDGQIINQLGFDNPEITYKNSHYNGSYNVFGIGSTEFSINLNQQPEKLSYSLSDLNSVRYTTNSRNSSGPISKVSILNSGSNYKKLPKILGFSKSDASSVGRNASLSCRTNSIGKLNQFRIINEGYNYSSDKTLNPETDVLKYVKINKSRKITAVDVLSGGKNYTSNPTLDLVDTYTRKKVDDGGLRAIFGGNSIVGVEVITEPKGLDDTEHELFCVNNSNGISVEKILSYSNGIVRCELSTPPLFGFITPPFKVGDLVFVEGLRKQNVTDILGNVTSPGTGFNSIDNGYRFFRVESFINSNPAILEFDIGEYTNNAGIPVTNQYNFYTNISKLDNYPIFKITQVPGLFYLNEKLIVNGDLTDLVVEIVNEDFIKVRGDYVLSIGDKLKGVNSGIEASVENYIFYENRFDISYSNKKQIGWENQSGKLSDDLQVIQNNDYYQSLSYSIKSPVEYDKWKDYVNIFAHPSGMKNFSDMQLDSKSSVSIGVTQSLLPTLDFISENRIDVIKGFDYVLDYNVDNLSPITSSSNILFKTKRLSDYVECLTNRVLQVDDISNRFSSSEFNKSPFTEVIEYPITDFYSRFLIQITDEQQISSQISEVIILNNYSDVYTANKVDIFTDEKLGDIYGDKAITGDIILRFDPVDPNTTNYNIKVYRQKFSPNPFNIGIGFTDVGFVRLTGKTENLGPNSGLGVLGISTSVFTSLIEKYNTVYAYAHITDTVTNEQNYFEVAAYHDGINAYISEYYFDTKSSISGLNSGFIGTFGVTLNNGVLDLVFKNENSPNDIRIKTKCVGIGTTSVGVGTYRYLVSDQIPETERTAKLESLYTVSSGISTTIATYSTLTGATVKSIVRVGVGSTVSIHNLYIVADRLRVNIQQTPFMSIGNNTGIGTFTASISGQDINVYFHPDPEYSSSEIVIQSYNEFLYLDLDEYNIPNDKVYGTTIESVFNSFYGSINEFGKDKLDFDMNYNNIPIFEKVFNPANQAILDKSTGIFSINDHFFETGEELIYTPGSTLIGINSEAIGIGSTLVAGTILLGDSIAGLSSITGIANSIGLSIGNIINGNNIPDSTTITDITQSYTAFQGSVVSGGSSVITGVANTISLKVGSGIFSGSNSIGTIYSIGINSITASQTLDEGNERLYYSDNLNWSIGLSNVATATTFRNTYRTGIVTDLCPSSVYAIRLSKDTFKITGIKQLAQSGIGFTFINSGSGNFHKFEMKKKLEKTLITIDGVTQYPLMYTPLSYNVEGNGSPIGSGISFMSISGISSIRPKDILKINDELLIVNNVGFGTSSFGPITGVGTVPVVEVRRGSLGTNPSTVFDNDLIRVYRGSYNVVGNKIYFTEAPDGRGTNERLNESNLRLPKSTFNGRVYLRRNYDFNKIYDDISDRFSGIQNEFTVYENGENTVGLEAGSNIVFINDVFQTPDTPNNSGNNYFFTQNEEVGISTINFTGITSANSNDIIVVDYDINQNQLPRGGVILGVAITGGLGYAPLIGANFRAELGVGNSITNIVGFPTYGESYTISTSSYNNLTGIIEITTVEDHPFDGSEDNVYLEGLEFACSSGAGTTTIYPSGNLGFIFPVVGIVSEKTFKANVGLSTIEHNYIGGGIAYPYYNALSFGSGYNSTVSIGITDKTGSGANISVSVGAGGTLIPTIVSGGSGYTEPTFIVDSPTYSNLPVVGVSRVSVGQTTEVGIGVSVTFSIAPSQEVGIGSTYFRVLSYEFTKRGYGFQLGDVFEPVGLVTDSRLNSPIEKLRFTVTELFNDTFASWQLGEFDYIDSIKELQDGKRTRFPLFKNSQLLSFQKNINNIESLLIDFDSILLIYVNGVMQEPGVSYQFTGGTTFLFSEAPKYEDQVDIFFYRGTRDIDSKEIDINETVKVGDSLHISRNESINGTVGQEPRIVSDIESSDVVKTGIYILDGIDDINYKPVDWIKQKRDIFIRNNPEYKSRDSLEGMVFPTTKIIKDFSKSDTEVFVDNAQFFNYEENESIISIPSVSAILIPLETELNSPKFFANVSAAGTISSIDIIDAGEGYQPNTTINLDIANPIGGIGPSVFRVTVRDRSGTVGIRSDSIVGIDTSNIKIGDRLKVIKNVVDETHYVVGINQSSGGTIYLNKDSYNDALLVKGFNFGYYQNQSKATATASVSSSGIVTTVNIISAGSGYTSLYSPIVTSEIPTFKTELISDIPFIQGFSGIITGITTSVGINGNPLALVFQVLYDSNSVIDDLKQGYPIYVSETSVGNGVTSIDNSDSQIIGIGSTFVDNIYYIHSISRNNLVGVITANIHSSTNVIGIDTSSIFAGRFSWGRMSGFERSSTSSDIIVSGLPVNVGLTSHPSLQRREYGLRDNGALRKSL